MAQCAVCVGMTRQKTWSGLLTGHCKYWEPKARWLNSAGVLVCDFLTVLCKFCDEVRHHLSSTGHGVKQGKWHLVFYAFLWLESLNWLIRFFVLFWNVTACVPDES